ncbi:FKBP-type peptidyl-prolyl cis-trans isomerase [Candidatus Chromulinivorax destructor]|uniref:Peptidyl-prolyl cis-trans isomerase n=1 Tax=Candidatus Chromulinivorax destructor TaxID=2066483 RepID=A0A345ZB58_9BACT|nr:FKBP-type peptidyl-prolyl cis-trans isomerase [Candidatus Chromulinivorax destructor]AXK60525.1 peptidylprolyl isomerase [Candidatus Chromulinivorax destructor]
MKSNITSGEMLHLEDFTTSKHGIVYKIVKESDQEKPEVGDIVTVHYTGCLLKGSHEVGKKFDSSLDRGEPFQFTLGFGQVIKGWDLSLADMKIGEERIVLLPAHLAYGDRSVSVIPANSTLIFDIKLLGTE